MKKGSTGQHYKKHHTDTVSAVVGALDTEIENYEEAIIQACNIFVEKAVDNLNKRAISLIDDFYNSYTPNRYTTKYSRDFIRRSYMRHYRLYKSLHPWIRQYAEGSSDSVYVMHGGLRIDSSDMKNYENQWFSEPPYTSASDVLSLTLLNKGDNGYHGWHGSHPGKQIEGQLTPIRSHFFDFVQLLQDYFNSNEFVASAFNAAQNQLNSII